MIRRRYAQRRVRTMTREGVDRAFESDQHLQEAWREFKRTGEERVRNRLIEHYLYLVKFNAERIGAKLPDEVDVDDLMSAGIFGLVDAIDAFDLERGVKFETYCAPRIRGAMLDELRNMDWVPRLVRHRTHKLDDATRALETELGRLPTEDELLRRLGLSRPSFERLIRDANAVSLVSLSRKHYDSDSERDVLEIDVLSDQRRTDALTQSQRLDIEEIVLKRLSRAERLIVVLYYYEQMTMKEIGATLDLSESRVSQMHSSILARLKEHLELTADECVAE
ncbi:MAG: RNA polymerase sigma factor FliA [Phycisphaerae bacterium]|nr:RNA polymerase sigma factor FliA [Phycisphaerae bacterium]